MKLLLLFGALASCASATINSVVEAKQCFAGVCLASDSVSACQAKIANAITVDDDDQCISYSYVCFPAVTGRLELNCDGFPANEKIVIFETKTKSFNCTDEQERRFGSDATVCCTTDKCNTALNAFTAVANEGSKKKCAIGQCLPTSTEISCKANLTFIPTGVELKCKAERKICYPDLGDPNPCPNFADDTHVVAFVTELVENPCDNGFCCATVGCQNITTILAKEATYTKLICNEGECNASESLNSCKENLRNRSVLTSVLEPFFCQNVVIDCTKIENDPFDLCEINSTLKTYIFGGVDQGTCQISAPGIQSSCCNSNLCNTAEIAFTEPVSPPVPTKSSASKATYVTILTILSIVLSMATQ